MTQGVPRRRRLSLSASWPLTAASAQARHPSSASKPSMSSAGAHHEEERPKQALVEQPPEPRFWLLEQSSAFLARAGARDAAAAAVASTAQASAGFPPSPMKKRKVTPAAGAASPARVENCLQTLADGGKTLEALDAERVRGPLCVCCQQPPLRPKVSVLCGHLACSSCWSQWLANKFDCPVCRRKVRPNNVIRILGWSD